MTRTKERSRSGSDQAPDFLELGGYDHATPSFECSTTRGGVAGGLSVTDGRLVLTRVGSTMSFRARDVLGWWDTSSGTTFSLAIETGARHTLVLLSEFRGATVHAMTRAFGPRRPLDGLSA
ncbi:MULTISPECIES: hypothetical protein [unclassified Rathayibacter]|uniref:hypothetical protein n=1 Tax=unclassified Rathayibacter TaxID=2609250 RepID=UPI00070239D2|nr:MULTISPECIES: hypothetical protein [unclassified Rathayibacter]KQQ05946.1 hypothetical protein ASF42_05250 [Rathayibacter sp. Leaf294]KQS13803.1 hypothetical protein ASG06_05260 [Rathayibacter sp. Leaf185]